MLGSRGHGGDGDGFDPNQPGWNPPSGCRERGSNKPPPRGKAKALNLEEQFEKNGNRPLPIYFDYKTKTWQCIGEFASLYKSKLGSMVGEQVPHYYNSWEEVPITKKNEIFNGIQHWFDLQRYIGGPEDDPTRRSVLEAVNADACSIYRGRKTKFKKKYFTDRGGLAAAESLRAYPPGDMDQAEWERLLAFYTREDQVRKSTKNAVNRSKQTVGNQGRRSIPLTHDRALAQHFSQPNPGPPPTYHNTWEITHKEQAAQYRAQLQEAQERHSQDPEPIPPWQLYPEVLGHRSGWERGVGRILKGSSGREFPDDLPQPVYGQPAYPYAGSSGSASNQPGFSPDWSGFADDPQDPPDDDPQDPPAEASGSSSFSSNFDYNLDNYGFWPPPGN